MFCVDLRVASVSRFLEDLNWLTCKCDTFSFTLWYLAHYCPNEFSEYFYNTLAVPFEKPKIVYFVSSMMKNIVFFPAHSRFPAHLICCIGFGSASSVCCLLRSIANSM